MKFNPTLCALGAMALMATSCLSNEQKDQVQTETFNSCISYTVDNTTGAVSAAKRTAITFETNYSQYTMGATVANLMLPGGINYPNAKFSGLKLTQNNSGWLIAEGSNVSPEVEGFSAELVPSFSNVRIAALNHIASLDGQSVIGYERAMRLNTADCTMYLTPSECWSTGYTDVEPTEGGEKYRSSKPIYLVGINPETQTAKITIHSAVFAPAMENLGLMIEFRDIPYTLTPNGAIVMARSEKFDPYHDNAPNAGFPISNLVCTWDIFSGINISFTCEVRGGSAVGSYAVSANLPFNYGAGTQQ